MQRKALVRKKEKNEMHKNGCQSGGKKKCQNILEVTKRFSFSLTFGLSGVCLLLRNYIRVSSSEAF
jgi:hypothetical protein